LHYTDPTHLFLKLFLLDVTFRPCRERFAPAPPFAANGLRMGSIFQRSAALLAKLRVTRVRGAARSTNQVCAARDVILNRDFFFIRRKTAAVWVLCSAAVGTEFVGFGG
jgi:hypothetical protein